MTCSSCNGPSDTDAPRCSWCEGIDKLSVRRDQARAEHDRQMAMQFAAAQRYADSGSTWSTVWTVRIIIGVALLFLRLVFLAAGH